MSVVAAGVRIGWSDLPEQVCAAVERILGGEVVEAVSQPGGFSPGTADRVRTRSGTRAFVKAVSVELNPRSVDMHRQEARITAALPVGASAPQLLGVHDDGQWVALVLSDVDGRHPMTPWQSDELQRVLHALDQLASALTPSPVHQVPDMPSLLAEDFAGWQRIAQDPPEDLDPWARAHLDALIQLAERGLSALAGDTLVHADMRADNLLLSPDGSVTVVDWPWASRGPAWLDTLSLLVNVRLYGGHDVESLLSEHIAGREINPLDVTAVLAGFGGFFLDVARRPAPPGLPTVRAFQRAQGDVVLSWLQERLDASAR